MKTEYFKKFLVWFLAFVLCYVLMQMQILRTFFGWKSGDLFMPLAAFALYYFERTEAFAVVLLAGILKDILYGAVLGPAILVCLLLIFLSTFLKDFLSNRVLWKGVAFSLVLGIIAKFAQHLIFHLLPLSGSAVFSLPERLRLAAVNFFEQIPATCLGFLLFYLTFYAFYPGFKQFVSTYGSNDLNISLEA